MKWTSQPVFYHVTRGEDGEMILERVEETADWEQRARDLERLALKAFTVVEWVVGEGKLLEEPHFDADDLLLEMVDILKVESSDEARIRLEKAEREGK